MSQSEVTEFVKRVMPSYEAYSAALNDKGMPGFVDKERTLQFKLD